MPTTLCPTLLFQGINEKELASMLACINATRRRYPKKSYVYRSGDRVTSLGLVLEGRVHCVREDFWGNRNLLSVAEPGMLLGEICAETRDETADSDAVAEEESEILFMDARRVLTVCPSACAFHTRLIRNLLRMVTEKTLLLNRKLECVTQRSTREKVLSFLSEEARKTGTASFAIALSRQQMADYLSVDRSALSSELGKLRAEGVLEFERNRFTLRR